MHDLSTIQRMNNAIESAKQRKLARALNERCAAEKAKRAAAVKRAIDTITRAEKTRTGAK